MGAHVVAGDAHFDDAVLCIGLHLAGVDAGRQADRPPELPADALAANPLTLLDLAIVLTLARDGEHVVVDRDVHVVGIDTGDLAGVSLEEDVAGSLRVGLGDTIVWEVSGIEVPSIVTSLRRVDWERLEPNFFAVLGPGVLEDAPQTIVLVARLPEERQRIELQRALVGEFPNVSALDLTVQTRCDTDVTAINRILREASQSRFDGVLGYTEELLASCDFNHDARSSIVDASQTRVSGKRLVKVLTWFDNEWGYANRMLDVAKFWGGL